jgi:hypothetical protein
MTKITFSDDQISEIKTLILRLKELDDKSNELSPEEENESEEIEKKLLDLGIMINIGLPCLEYGKELPKEIQKLVDELYPED